MTSRRQCPRGGGACEKSCISPCEIWFAHQIRFGVSCALIITLNSVGCTHLFVKIM